MTSLHLAITNPNVSVELVNLLIDVKCDVNAVNKRGKTVLQLAEERNITITKKEKLTRIIPKTRQRMASQTTQTNKNRIEKGKSETQATKKRLNPTKNAQVKNGRSDPAIGLKLKENK